LPTGPFASLPIHAAGIYDAPDSECTSDYVISSYTSTLSALLAPSPHAPEHFKVLAVIQPVTNEQAPLPYTIDELQKIEAHVPNECLIRRGVPGAPTYVTEVLADIPTASIVHLACHGVQDVWNPLNSALLLEDGRLRVSQLMELDMPNASLVFLSACQTAMVGDDLPDESMHLAATLLFSGFRGAVATMWWVHSF
jgi:CHAT domain-containing protein